VEVFKACKLNQVPTWRETVWNQAHTDAGFCLDGRWPYKTALGLSQNHKANLIQRMLADTEAEHRFKEVEAQWVTSEAQTVLKALDNALDSQDAVERRQRGFGDSVCQHVSERSKPAFIVAASLMARQRTANLVSLERAYRPKNSESSAKLLQNAIQA